MPPLIEVVFMTAKRKLRRHMANQVWAINPMHIADPLIPMALRLSPLNWLTITTDLITDPTTIDLTIDTITDQSDTTDLIDTTGLIDITDLIDITALTVITVMAVMTTSFLQVSVINLPMALCDKQVYANSTSSCEAA
jgi:hypothetical protein